MQRCLTILTLILVYLLIIPNNISAQTSSDWYMAGANPQRTSWVASTTGNQTEIKGMLYPAWYRPIEPYILPKTQIIVSNDLIYLSTSKGLYAFHTGDNSQYPVGGELAWVYPTNMPLGHSPTIVNGIAYVGGFDHKIHALNAITGQALWSFKADSDGIGAGFDTNPLVVGSLVYAGNRDGYLYAVYANGHQNQGQLAWKYNAGSPINFSAAYYNGAVFFATNQGYAFSLNALTGQLNWRSDKLPTAGFRSWWPVIVEGKVMLSAGRSYRLMTAPQLNLSSLNYNGDPAWPDGEDMGPLLPDGRMDATRAIEYFEEPSAAEKAADPYGINRTNHRPWRRTYYLLNTQSGTEVTIDHDNDGLPGYAPLMTFGTSDGNRYPPVIGPDNTIYTPNRFKPWGYSNGISGWNIGQTAIKTTGQGIGVPDEPIGVSMAGNQIYWNVCCDRLAGSLDTTNRTITRYYSYSLHNLIPGYDQMMLGTFEANAVQVYGGWNGVYGSHTSDQSPPIPYKGKVYMHRGNALIAWSKTGGATKLPKINSVTTPVSNPSINQNSLSQKLTSEVQKILSAGHLRPGFDFGTFSHAGKVRGDNFQDYFAYPWDIFYTLSLAAPHLSDDLRNQVKNYLATEYQNFPPYNYTHIGYRDGASRDYFDLPPEVEGATGSFAPSMWSTHAFPGWRGPDWKWPPHMFYAMWKYAKEFGNAGQIFQQSRLRLYPPPTDSIFDTYPLALNAHISGYYGYLQLKGLAGDTSPDTYKDPQNVVHNFDVSAELNRLRQLRVNQFNKDNPWGPDSHDWGQTMAVNRNFTFLTPELGQYLKTNAFAKMDEALKEYEFVAPYWFVTWFETTYNEESIRHLYDYDSIFKAKAYIFGATKEELVKYLDVPAFERGDLFYIQNLVAAIEAPSSASEFNPDLNSDTKVDFADYTLFLPSFDSLFSISNFNKLVSWFGKLI